MKNAELLVFRALNSDQTLITLLGGKKTVKNEEWKRIYNSPAAPHTNELPRINLFEAANTDTEFADNEAQTSDVNIRLEFRTTDESKIFDTVSQIKKVIKAAFVRSRIELGAKQVDASVEPKIVFKPINIFLLLEQGE